MAMEKLLPIRETHVKPITVLGYNPAKHELLAGCEDGVIKAWDYSTGEPGKLVRTSHEHAGWVTCFLFWSDAKLMLSASNDGTILAWGSGVQPHDKVEIGSPIYSMAWNVRRGQLILGMKGAVKVHLFKDLANDLGHFISRKGFTSKKHTDIVSSVACHETRVYSAGYDRRIVIYDSFSYHEFRGLKAVTVIYPAHEAGISTLTLAKDTDNNTWLLTGGFDKTVKVWSIDGQLIHKFESLSSNVTGLCYVRQTKTIWVVAGGDEASLYDPKSGDNVSEFIGTFQGKDRKGEESVHGHELLLLQYMPDIGQVFGTNLRRQILCWKYNPCGCITTLKNRDGVESVTYTKKVPLLIFSGDSDGQITKWEQLQSNNFMYSKELLLRSEGIGRLAAQISVTYDWVEMDKTQIRDQLLQKQAPSFAGKFGEEDTTESDGNAALLKALFVEDLDLLVVASEDGNIYVWGFDNQAVQVLHNMKKPDDDKFYKNFGILLTDKNADSPKIEESELNNDDSSVTNRVAGFICRHVFTDHNQVVSAMVVVGREAGFGSTYLITSGWDRRILLWDLEELRLQDVFRNRNKEFESEELAADGNILDLAFSPSRNEFAYAATDKLVYVRKFATSGLEMTLSAVLQGHEAEVTRVEWNHLNDKWVTGSEDGTIRVWSGSTMACELVMSAHGVVSALCIDKINGCIVAGVQDTIRVYDLEYKKIVQTNVGHTESVRSIMHIPERQQYISVSWDKTVRIWNAYIKAVRRKTLTLVDTKEERRGRTAETQQEDFQDIQNQN